MSGPISAPASTSGAVQGHQVVLEGLVADILNEHFGEAVELVGIVLFRNGQLGFSEIVRICNLNFLAFPRDAVNPYNEYSQATFSSESISFKAVRDSLLVLIHHGLVSVTAGSPGLYSLNAIEIINRLFLPVYLDLFSDEQERTVLEHVLKRSMIARAKLIDLAGGRSAKDSVSALMARRVLVPVESLTATAGAAEQADIALRFNATELQLSVLKQYIVDFVRAKQDVLSASVIEQLLTVVISASDAISKPFPSRISVGELAIADIAKNVNVSSNDLISALIKLQQNNMVGKKQFSAAVASAAPASKKRKAPAKPARAANNKQLLAMAAEDESGEEGYFSNLLATDGAPAYSIKFLDVIEEIETDIVHHLVKAKYGVDAARVFVLLSSSRQKYEASHVADLCAISREDALKHLHGFASDGLCQIQEVPKVVSSSAAASGGLVAMMRAVASSFWLYYIEEEKVRRSLISLLANSIINLRRRFRFEVNRQCKIEDRASVLTKAEQEYLESVHSAQDLLEANSIQLVFSLMILLIRG